MTLGITEQRQALCFFMCRQVGDMGVTFFFLALLPEESGEAATTAATCCVQPRIKKTQMSRNSTGDERSTTSFYPPALVGVGGESSSLVEGLCQQGAVFKHSCASLCRAR